MATRLCGISNTHGNGVLNLFVHNTFFSFFAFSSLNHSTLLYVKINKSNLKAINNGNKKIVARREKISIIDLNLIDLDVKIDTGANSNALHCDHIVIDEATNRVSFVLLDEVHESYHGRKITLPIYKIKKSEKFKRSIRRETLCKSNGEIFWKRV